MADIPTVNDTPETVAYLQTIFGNAALMREFAEAQSGWTDEQRASWMANAGNYPFVMSVGTGAVPPYPPSEPPPEAPPGEGSA